MRQTSLRPCSRGIRADTPPASACPSGQRASLRKGAQGHPGSRPSLGSTEGPTATPPLGTDGARPVLQVFADAYEAQSVVIATDLESGGWGSVFGDDRMAAAVIDRMVHHGRLVQFRGESHHMRHALIQEG